MRPPIDKFTEAMDKFGGNVTAVAKAFGVRRNTVYMWMNDAPEYKAVLEDARGSFLDDALTSARILVRGIPDIVNGKQVGWITPPDSGMVRYVMGTLGRSEGFGENLDITTNGKDIGLFRVLTKDEMKEVDEQFDKDY